MRRNEPLFSACPRSVQRSPNSRRARARLERSTSGPGSWRARAPTPLRARRAHCRRRLRSHAQPGFGLRIGRQRRSQHKKYDRDVAAPPNPPLLPHSQNRHDVKFLRLFIERRDAGLERLERSRGGAEAPPLPAGVRPVPGSNSSRDSAIKPVGAPSEHSINNSPERSPLCPAQRRAGP
jgi:hypothetical protein